MWTRLVLALAAVLLVSAPATAQDNPVMAHYRAYRAALASNDMPAAETAAEGALAASVARDGDGGRTAILALNLAQVRLARGRIAEAYAPAVQASTIASANPAAGVDPLLARIALGRAELTEAHGREGRDRLLAALPEALNRPDLNGDAYSAASDLGRWLFAGGDFTRAINAWGLAVQFADAAGADNVYARAEARLGEGVARLSLIASDENVDWRRPTDTRLQRRAGDDGYRQANDALTQAVQLLEPLALTDGGGLELTTAQRTYASAVAWRALLRARVETSNQRFEIAGSAAQAEGVPAMAGPPACDVRVITQPEPDFPPGARATTSAGAVVVRLLLDEQGQIVDSRVAAALPGRWFQDAVEEVLPQWRAERGEGPANCAVQRVQFMTYRFYFRS